MPNRFKTLTNYFIEIGAEDIAHTEKTYLAHAIGVYNDMRVWTDDPAMAEAALFHSIYGTQQFQGFKLPLERRDELKSMIGERAEKLAFLNCFMLRETLDAQLTQQKETYTIANRETMEPIELTKEEYDDLVCLHLCDLLEQVERSSAWDMRRSAYRQMAERLGGQMLASYDEVFAREPR
ncbi:MAG: DUF6817 domain-containing protein [Chloroflexota bacterium]